MKPVEPIHLQNAYVQLAPVKREEASAYVELGQDPDIWRYLPGQPFQDLHSAQQWIDTMLSRPEYALTFSVYDAATGHLAGSSSYLNVASAHSSLEIGFTWYGKAFRRTRVNTAAKLALMSHAFEDLGAVRVQLQTDERNVASQKAIERIGGQREGVLRKHKTYADGYIRNTVVFSIVDDEWPAVKVRLQSMLAA